MAPLVLSAKQPTIIGSIINLRLIAFAIALLLATKPALAAGGSHVIDDSEVAAAGSCQLDGWTSYSTSGWLAVVAPACTIGNRVPVEIHAQGTGVRGAFTIGAGFKAPLRSPARGIGLALTSSASLNASDVSVEGGGVALPITLDVLEELRLNGNVGYLWSRQGDRHSAFAGIQVEAGVAKRLILMAEAFRHDSGATGLQAGLRWTPLPALDLDVVARRSIDGTTVDALTIGFTVRNS